MRVYTSVCQHTPCAVIHCNIYIYIYIYIRTYILARSLARSLRGRTQPHNKRFAVVLWFNTSKSNYRVAKVLPPSYFDTRRPYVLIAYLDTTKYSKISLQILELYYLLIHSYELCKSQYSTNPY